MPAIPVQCPACRKSYSVDSQLLGCRGRCRHCGERFALAPSSDGTEPSPETSTPGAIPARIGRFALRSRLGSGAFGSVYRAHDPDLDREVALKVPHPGSMGDRGGVERFLREARAMARIRHPNIVPVFETGLAGGDYYIASEYIAGRTLADVVARGPLEPGRAASIAADLAAALQAAHDRGIVHRDVKPSNAMIDAEGRALLMDFGLALWDESTARLTHDGAVFGTPAYMAPEQARGQSAQATAASDQYALGVVLYELLCGQVPFSGPAAVVIYHAVHDEPQRPSDFHDGVPPALEAICLKAMAKSPADRHADCASFRRALLDASRSAEGLDADSASRIRGGRRVGPEPEVAGRGAGLKRRTLAVSGVGAVAACLATWWVVGHRSPPREAAPPLAVQADAKPIPPEPPVAATPRRLRLASSPDRDVSEGERLEVNFKVEKSDEGGGSPHFSLGPGAPPGAEIDAASGTFRWIPTEEQGPGKFPVVVRVTRPGGGEPEDEATIVVRVAEVNAPPVLDSPSDREIDSAAPLTFSVKAYDPDVPRARLVYSLGQGAPTAARIDAGTGVFSLASGALRPGRTYPITVRAAEPGKDGLSQSSRFKLIIRPRPPSERAASLAEFREQIARSTELPSREALLMAPAVHADLELTSLQRGRLENLGRIDGFFEGKGNESGQFKFQFGTPPSPSMAAQMANAKKEMARAAKDQVMGKMMEVLTPDQQGRLTQIAHQVEGPWALARPEVTEKLRATAAQKQAIREALKTPSVQGRWTPAAFETASRKVDRALKPEQKAALEALLGEPFDPAVLGQR